MCSAGLLRPISSRECGISFDAARWRYAANRASRAGLERPYWSLNQRTRRLPWLQVDRGRRERVEASLLIAPTGLFAQRRASQRSGAQCELESRLEEIKRRPSY